MDEPNGKAAANKIVDDRRSGVRRAGIDDDDLGAIAKAFEAFPDAGGLVEADHRSAQAKRTRRRRFGGMDRRQSRGIG